MFRDYPPTTEYRRPVTPPPGRYTDYPPRSGTEARARFVMTLLPSCIVALKYT